jgi:mRNA interferase RelE/StbE
MPEYELEILPSAQRSLNRLDRPVRRRVATRIDALAEDPRPQGATKLVGSKHWRIRIGDYRVVYDIKDAQLIVLVIEVGHRREIYR